jgi:hypothetical protein
LVGDIAFGAASGAALGGLGSMVGSGLKAAFGGGLKNLVSDGLGAAASRFGSAFRAEGANIFGGLKNAGQSLLSKASAGINQWGTSAMAATKSAADDVFKNGLPTIYKATQTVIGRDRATSDNAATLVNEGLHDVIVHGGRDGMAIVEEVSVNPGHIVDLIRNNPGYTAGQGCRLLVCHAGASGLAQDVANGLGVPVRGATNVVRAIVGGGTEVGHGGYWRTFLPIIPK